MDKKIKVSFPTDKNGLTGRECPGCGDYFKIKFGTGLEGEPPCHCPYCSHSADHYDFMTKAQREYIESIAVKEVLGPLLDELDRSFKKLERATHNSFIQIKVRTSGNPVRIKYYREHDLETRITCDSCGLEFAVYGVFATCPDCTRLNASVVFAKSVEVAEKRLLLVDLVEDTGSKEAVLKDSLSGGISAFDAFGKALREHHPGVFPDRPRNLFQNLKALEDAMRDNVGHPLDSLIDPEDLKTLRRLFQVRHIYEHNMGVIDDRFISNIPEYSHMKGRKYPLRKEEISSFLEVLKKTGIKIEEKIE